MSEASLMSGEPGLPVVSRDSDLDQLPGPDPEDHPGAAAAALSSGPRGLDTHQACSWPELRTLLQQLPPQDSDERYCLALGKEEQAELQLFHAQRKQEALGQGVARLVPPQLEGYTCEKCRKQLKPGDYGVFAARAGERHCWHRPCFACQVCGQALINLIYFYHDGHLYCGRHHAELLRPRCPACDQLIFSRRCTEAEGRHWHENHFCCQDCAGPLCGGRYALPGGSPCCPSCFESRYSDAGSSRPLEGLATLAAPPAPPSPPCPPPPPDASLRARSSHRASLAGALQGPPGPTPRRGRGCGARLAPGRGTRPPSGEAGPDGSKRRDGTSLDALSSHETPFLVASSNLEAQQGLLGSCPEEPQCQVGAEGPSKSGQDRLQMPRDPKEDAPCSTCSSSSDSEPEGFFFGQPLPRSRNAPGRPEARDNDTPRKHCTLS